MQSIWEYARFMTTKHEEYPEKQPRYDCQNMTQSFLSSTSSYEPYIYRPLAQIPRTDLWQLTPHQRPHSQKDISSPYTQKRRGKIHQTASARKVRREEWNTNESFTALGSSAEFKMTLNYYIKAIRDRNDGMTWNYHASNTGNVQDDVRVLASRLTKSIKT